MSKWNLQNNLGDTSLLLYFLSSSLKRVNMRLS